METENRQPPPIIVNQPPPLYSEIPGTVPLNEGVDSSPPPSYDDVVDPEASPPTYQSLFGQVREARKNSKHVLEFLRKVIVLLLGTIGCTIVLGVTIIVPISMVIIGTQYYGDCPVQPCIPIYLIVGGFFGVVKNILSYCARCRKNDEDDNVVHRVTICSNTQTRDNIINLFIFAWFLTGCIWTYRVYEPEYENKNSVFYCHKTVYQFAFWLVTSCFFLTGLLILFCTCFIISSMVTNME